jgi:protein SCO1/2
MASAQSIPMECGFVSGVFEVFNEMGVNQAWLRTPLVAILLAVLLTACGSGKPWHLKNVSGLLPPLHFKMRRANGKLVTAQDFRGKVVLLYFGYTHCPDVCPLTLAKISRALHTLGAGADQVRVLFVTVDPARDTLAVLHRYTKAFGPNFVGLRDDDGQLQALAKRYRVTYTAQPPNAHGNYQVIHSSGVFIFDRQGDARLLATSSSKAPAISADLKRLIRD